jgi:hypothetical protein
VVVAVQQERQDSTASSTSSEWINSNVYSITSAWKCQVKITPEKSYLIDIRKFAPQKYVYSRGISIPAYKLPELITAINSVAQQVNSLGVVAKPSPQSGLAQIEQEAQLNVVHVEEFGCGYLCRLVYFIERGLYYIDIRKQDSGKGACIPASACMNLVAAIHSLPTLLEQQGYDFE